MTHFNGAWEEHQRKRFTRPDAHRWVRPNAKHGYIPVNRKFYEKLSGRKDSALDKELNCNAAEARSARLLMLLRLNIARMRAEELRRKYSDDQPRDDHGRWTTGNNVSQGINDPRILSDASPDGHL